MPLLLTTALLLASSPTVPSTLEIFGGGNECYDAALIGRIIESRDIVALNDVVPTKPDQLYLGAASSALVRRDSQLEGHSPKLGWVRIVSTSQPLRTTKLLLLTKAHPSGTPIVVYLDLLPRTAGMAEFKRALSEAPVARCG